MGEDKEQVAFRWVKTIVPVLIVLAGGQGYQMYTAEDNTKEVIDANLDHKFKQLKHRQDSIIKEFKTKDLKIFADGLAALTNMSGKDAEKFTTTIVPWALDKFKEDSTWQNIEKPMLYEVYEWYSNSADIIKVTDGILTYKTPTKWARVYYSIPDGQTWKEPAYWYIDDFGKIQVLIHLKRLVL